MNITEPDLMWLVGILEGEGTFDAHRGKYPRVRLGMVDRDVVGRAATLMGTRVRLSLHKAPYQASWHTEVSGVKAADIMQQLLPHMGSRRSAKIATVLGHTSLRAGQKPGPRISRPPGLPVSDVSELMREDAA